LVRLPTLACLVLGLTFIASRAAAQDGAASDDHVIAERVAEVDPWAYDRPFVRVTTDFSFFTGSADIDEIGAMNTNYFGMGFLFKGDVRVWEDLWVEAAWGFPHGSFTAPITPPIGGGGTRLGNPYLGASYVIDARPVRLTFGLGLTFPVSRRPTWDPTDPTDLDDLAKTLADLFAARIEGNVRPWLYLADTMSIVARGRIESVGHLLLAAELAVAPMFATSATGVYSGDTELVLVPTADIGYRLNPWLALGVRGQVAVFPTEPDETLGSVEPFVNVERRDVGHFRLGFVLQLGGPSGTTFHREGLWALRLTAGIVF
jgi:hypothetical protein